MDSLVRRNMGDIKRIIVTEDFLHMLQQVEDQVDFQYHENEEGEESWTLFGAPVVLSSMITGEQCILEMNDGEFVILS